MAQVDSGPSSQPAGGPPSSHPNPLVPPPAPAGPEQWTFQTPNGTIVSPSSPPRRKSSRRPMSSGSGEWLSGATAGKLRTSAVITDRPKSSHMDKHTHHRHQRTNENMQSVIAGETTAGATQTASNSQQVTSSRSPPPPEPLKTIGDDLIYGGHASWPPDKERILLGPFEYMYGHPGKDIRTQLIAAFNSWLKVPEESLKTVTKVVGMLHTASLLVDDVEDSSNLRRGVPVAHSLFGIPQTLNSANYIYFLALQALNSLPNSSAALSVYTEELLNLHRGQGMDLFWRDTLTCPSESDYLEMVSNKTGGLFRLAIKLMQSESPVSIDCIPLVQAISLYFQILDDLLNLQSAAYKARKGHCEDLTEGKFSFPVIHAVRADPSNLELMNILRMKTTDDAVKRYAVSYMERVGSFEYTRKVLAELEAKALVLLGEIEKKVGGEDGRRGAAQIREILAKLKAL